MKEITVVGIRRWLTISSVSEVFFHVRSYSFCKLCTVLNTLLHRTKRTMGCDSFSVTIHRPFCLI